ncbi:hypothetical protein B7494_g2266 [Chlorociboria aeruginascens]|nr:hypothetical protein B7494_g2266 [Chlorociboria aeruginascens]
MLKPALLADFPTLARLEADAFRDEEFSMVAFGPEGNSEENLAIRAVAMARQPTEPGKTMRFMKAVIEKEGKEEIVGFAGWGKVIGREKTEEGGGKEKKQYSWGIGANVKLCEDVFLKADEDMERAIEGKDYMKCWSLMVSRNYQRRGIGTLLLEDGLKEADADNLPMVLGASPGGIELYRKYGFRDFEVMDTKLWEYEGELIEMAEP